MIRAARRAITAPLQLASDVLYEIALAVDLIVLVVDGTSPKEP